MYSLVNNFVFDSDRLLIYKNNLMQDIKDIINKEFPSDSDYESVLLNITGINAEEMCMDKIAINNIGICLTYNCNLRCTYCGYSSTESNSNELEFSDIKIFVNDVIQKRTIKKLLTKVDEPLMVNFTGGGELGLPSLVIF